MKRNSIDKKIGIFIPFLVVAALILFTITMASMINTFYYEVDNFEQAKQGFEESLGQAICDSQYGYGETIYTGTVIDDNSNKIIFCSKPGTVTAFRKDIKVILVGDP